MAVWIYAFGNNGLLTQRNVQTKNILDALNSILLDEVKILDSIIEIDNKTSSTNWIKQHYTENRANIENRFKAMSADEYNQYLQSINLPHIEIDEIVDRFIIDGVKREQEKEAHFNFAYAQFKNVNAKSKWEIMDNGSFVNKLCYFANHDGIRINLINDLVYISGPFSVFSVYSSFQKSISAESREYYHSYFKKILQVFKSDFILYAHEWSLLYDVDDKEFNLFKLKAKLREGSTSKSIHTMEGFYFEEIK